MNPLARRGWTLALASLGMFMTALDTLIVATALPVLRVELDASLEQLEWTVNAYNLAFACLILTGAALGDRFGRRRMFAVGLGVFTVASVAAAMSGSVDALIAARALQGVGAAIVMPLTLTLISDAFPAEKRAVAIGLWGGIAGTAVAAGPVVGGAIIEGVAWEWIFWLNVPIGIVLIPLALRFLRESHGPRPQLDIPGLTLAGLGLMGLTWGLVRTASIGWGNVEVLASLAAGCALVGGFIAWERRTRHPMLPLAYFRRRGFATANGVSFFMLAALFGSLFMITQFLQTVLGHSPLQAGLRILPWTGLPMLVAPIAGALAERYGNRPFMTLGLMLQAIGLAWVALIAEPGVGYAQLGSALVVAGLGISLCFPTVANAVIASVPLDDAGLASGTNSAIRELGGVFGIALVATLFAHQGSYATTQAFSDGFAPALWLAAGLSAAGIVVALLSPGQPGQFAASAPTRSAAPCGQST